MLSRLADRVPDFARRQFAKVQMRGKPGDADAAHEVAFNLVVDDMVAREVCKFGARGRLADEPDLAHADRPIGVLGQQPPRVEIVAVGRKRRGVQDFGRRKGPLRRRRGEAGPPKRREHPETLALFGAKLLRLEEHRTLGNNEFLPHHRAAAPRVRHLAGSPKARKACSRRRRRRRFRRRSARRRNERARGAGSATRPCRRGSGTAPSENGAATNAPRRRCAILRGFHRPGCKGRRAALPFVQPPKAPDCQRCANHCETRRSPAHSYRENPD